jgi:glycine cleavage system regulatory protein
MDSQFVMTVIAKDRPGLVESLSRIVADHQGNWLESRMAHLGGQFAGILRASVPAASAEKLLNALRGLESSGIKVSIIPDSPPAGADGGRRAELSLVGQDRPGIVRQIAQALARNGINVEELRTETSSAPMTGETLFHTEAEVQLPQNCSISQFRGEMEKIASDLMVDIKLHELTTP